MGIRNVTIRGAGMWHSQLYSLIEPQDANTLNHPHEGNFGFDIDKNIQISDIAIFGSGRIRGGDGNDEGGVGLNGRFGAGTTISNVWIEHANVGVWVGRDYDNIPELWGPADGLQFTGMRIRNTYADGINFTNGTRNSRVFNSSFRTTGDDALADLGQPVRQGPEPRQRPRQPLRQQHDPAAVARQRHRHLRRLRQQSIENNLVYDTMNYPGIMLATDHSPLPFGGHDADRQQRAVPHRRRVLERGPGVRGHHPVPVHPADHRRHHPRHRHRRLHLRRHPVQERRRRHAGRPDHQRADHKSHNGAGILAMSGVSGNAILYQRDVRRERRRGRGPAAGPQFSITGS